MSDFQKQVVIVTGAGSGIGRGIALRYAAEGASVVLADRNEASCKETLQLIQADSPQAITHVAVTDVSVPEQIVSLMQNTVKSCGRIDILINNAGITAHKSPYDLSVEEWDQLLNINLRGVFLCAREAAKHMRETGGGSIVNIASTRAFMSEPNTEAYAAAKGGVVALTHALAVSLGPDRIRVNAICPGWIETGDYERLRQMDHEQHPSMRVGRPDDIARACLFLTHPNNDFITGENLVIDGGMTKKMIYIP